MVSVTTRPTAGPLTSTDLDRVIRQYAARKQWTVEERARVASPAGLRRAVLEVRGGDAYARLRWLHGIHRVQRNQLGPPGRIKTSTAAVLVTPLDATEAKERRGTKSQGDAIERIRTCNYPQDRITDHRIPLTLRGLDRLVDAHLDRLADLLDAGNGQGRDGSA